MVKFIQILDIFYHFYNNNPKTANNYLKLVSTSLGYNNFQVFHHWTSKELSGNTLTWVKLTLAIDICVWLTKNLGYSYKDCNLFNVRLDKLKLGIFKNINIKTKMKFYIKLLVFCWSVYHTRTSFILYRIFYWSNNEK